MKAWLEIVIVSTVVASAGLYLVRLAIINRRGSGGGCGSTSSCGDQCRLVVGKKD